MNEEELIQKIEELSEVVRAQKEAYYSTHFYEFNRDILGWPDIYEPLHREVCDFVQNNINNKKLLVLLPRGTFKSSIVTVGYALWRILKNPNERILIANATYPMAISFLKQIKDHLERNQKIKEIFGDYFKTADAWRTESITLRAPGEQSYRGKEPTVSVYGMGSNLTGSHFTLALLDDMVNRDTIATPEQMQKVIDFYKDTLDLLDPVGGRKQMIVVGTTWHQSDLYSWILDRESGVAYDFETMRKPAFTGDWNKGELLFSPRLGWKELEDLKRQQGPSHFAAQYLLDPVPPENAIFSNFKYYDDTELEGKPINKFIAVDPAVSEKESADYSAMVCVGVDKDGRWYILDIWRDQVNPNRLINQIFLWDLKWKPVQIGVESNAFQKVLQFYIYEEMKKRHQFLPIKELNHTTTSKDARIRSLEPLYANGMVLHDKSNEFNQNLEDELMHFPRTKNDDLMDALASMTEISYPPRVKEKRSSRTYNVYPA
jgi:predicted phage terminase large subunit-like protein